MEIDKLKELFQNILNLKLVFNQDLKKKLIGLILEEKAKIYL